MGELPAAWPEEQFRSIDRTGGQVRGAGNEEFEHRAHIEPVTRLSSGSSSVGLSSSGPVEGLVGSKWANGPPEQGPLEGALLKGVATVSVGPAFGPFEGRAADGLKVLPCGPSVLLGGSPRPFQA